MYFQKAPLTRKDLRDNGCSHGDVWPPKFKMQERERILDGAMIQDAGFSLQELALRGVGLSSSKPTGKDKDINKLGTKWKRKLRALLPNKIIIAKLRIYCVLSFLNTS